MALREPPVALFYDPTDLDPDAPRLRVLPEGEGWALRDCHGTLVSRHSTQTQAIDAALERSKARFSQILVRGPAGDAEWLLPQGPAWDKSHYHRRQAARRRFDMKSLRFNAGLRLICTSRWLIPGRKLPAELFYDPEQLKPDAPRLHIARGEGGWEVRDGEDALLSAHSVLPDALDAAFERSARCYSEILVAGAGRRSIEWSAHHNPEMVELARYLNAGVPSERQAAT